MSTLARYMFILRYLEFLQSCGVLDPARYTNAMGAAYINSNRAYHNHTHILFMLDKLTSDINQNKIELNDWERKTVIMAIWWHDFVYDPQSKDNEIQSIAAWEQFVDQVAQESSALLSFKTPVSLLINCTITHTVPSTAEDLWLSDLIVSYFLDLDLAILATERVVYQAYAEGIRNEYISYTIEDYRKGRVAVLKGFLERENIFLMSGIEGKVESMRDMEKRARNNIGWEVGELEAGRLPER
ncbi:hypothetical protein TWF694_003290 [Orbilia ellipsospora]|uniref:HD domain-containing protein n=1 Tax=Orbilia ellipsospora TaxID=2528407 RepID=A0AAV9X3K2_9PEZI